MCIQHVIQRVVIRANVYIDAGAGVFLSLRSSGVIGLTMEISRARYYAGRGYIGAYSPNHKYVAVSFSIVT